MARESKANKTQRAVEINDRLRREYPAAACALRHANAYELLVATILSAQCTDKRVNLVTPDFFRRFPDAVSLAEGEMDEIIELIRSTGFFNNKAKNLRAMADKVVAEHSGQIPAAMDELVLLPGVGRKTANVILGNVFGIPGLVVDTHMLRLTNLLGLAKGKDAVKIEHAVRALLPAEEWTIFSHRIIEHGRAVCIARRPRCEDCALADLCPSSLAGVRATG